MADDSSPTRDQLEAVVESVRDLSTQVRRLNVETARQSTALDRSRAALVVVVVALVLALAVGAWGALEGRRANKAISDNEAQRQERSIASCKQTNDFYEKHNALVDNDQETFRIIIRESSSAPAQAFAQQRLDSYEGNKVKLRDCSPEGINAYLSTTTTTR